MNYFQVNSEDITRLNDFELTKLLSILLYNEANKFGLVKNSVSVALNITVADGGEDGHIRWNNNIEFTDWIPNRYTLFQVKATDMPPSACKQEVLGSNGLLKVRVKDVITAQGSYILFHSRELNQKQILERIEAFRETITSINPNANPSIEIYDASKIAEWCNQYISAIYAVWEWNGKSILMSGNTWEAWSGHIEFQNQFISNYEIEQKINELRDYLSDKRKVARIIGLPGKGKTRLALEVFRGDGNTGLEALNKGVIYVDATYSKDDIFSSITSWRNLGVSGIIIVDNCDYELHKILKSAVEHIDSNFSLLTLDYNLHKPSSSDPLINLEDVPKEIIEGIIQNSYPEMDEGDLNRIVNFADGFPSIATLLAEARINDFETIGSIQDVTLIKKLLWGRDAVDDMALKVIEACAVFEHIGFADEKEFEMKYVAENICGITIDDFYEKCSYFMKKKLIVQHGRYIKLVPKTLAITLASQWWEKCRPQKAQEILSNESLPSSMIEQLCSQISKLHFLEKAKELTSNLCGVQAPFGQAVILSSKVGSRIFCSFVEIDPVVTAETLEREFGVMSINELRQVKDGRRDLIRALEKLCFWEETFETAAKILARFAAAENEHWSNNATGQFNQLFHYILSGTQANLQSRISIIKWAMFSQEEEVKEIGVGAANHALQSEGFSRMIGVENQGSRPSMQEWKPNNWGEIFDYWDQTMDLLVEFAIKEDDCSNLIFDVIVDNIFGLIRSGYVESIDENLKIIFEKRDYYWPEFIEKINMILKFDESKMPKKVVDLIKSWEEKLQPKDIKTKIMLLVSSANDDYVETKDNESASKYQNATHIRIDGLIEEIYPRKMEELKTILSILLLGEQKQTFFFGKQLLNKMLSEEKEGFLELVFMKVKEIISSKDQQELNMNFLGGILNSLQLSEPDLLKEFLTELDNEQYAFVFIEMIRYIEVNEVILNSLLRHIRNSFITVDNLLVLAYGPALNNINEHDLIPFLKSIYELENGFNQVVAWKIYYRFYLINQEITRETSKYLSYLLGNSISILSNQNIFYEVNDILNKLYDLDFVDKKNLSRNILNTLLNLLSTNPDYNTTSLIGKYVGVVTKNTPKISWELLSSKLLEADGIYKYKLKDILGNGFFKEDFAAIQYISIEDLKEWSKIEENAPELLADIYPVNVDREDDFIHYLIENYADNEMVLRNITRQLRTFSWSGSLIPYYEKLKGFYKRYSNGKPPIRKWALENIHYLDLEIKKEKIREEEEKLRF